MIKCNECDNTKNLTKFTTLHPQGEFYMCAICLVKIEAETEAQQKEDLQEYWAMVSKDVS